MDYIESIIQEHVDRMFMKDPIEKALVWNESNDQLESESVGFKDASSARKGSDSVMHMGH